MKALSLLQPWATLVMLGAKRYETRTWTTRYRGRLAIHASKRFPDELRALCKEERFRRILRQADVASWSDLPTGAVLGTVELVACLPACELLIGDAERSLGDYGPGRWAWQLEGPRLLRSPMQYRGMRGIFTCSVLAHAV